MSRIRACAALILATAVVIGALPAEAQSPSRRVFIMWMDGSTIDDWSSPSLPSFQSLLNNASLAILSTRTARESTDPTIMRENAAATFGAGSQAAARGGIAGFVFNDRGVLVTAPIAMFAAAVVFSTLLTPR